MEMNILMNINKTIKCDIFVRFKLISILLYCHCPIIFNFLFFVYFQTDKSNLQPFLVEKNGWTSKLNITELDNKL